MRERWKYGCNDRLRIPRLTYTFPPSKAGWSWLIIPPHVFLPSLSQEPQEGGEALLRCAMLTPSFMDAAATPQLNFTALVPGKQPSVIPLPHILIPHSKLLQSFSHSKYNSVVVLNFFLLFEGREVGIYDRPSGDCKKTGCNSNRLKSGDAGLLIYWSVTQRRYPGLLMCFCFPSPSLKWSLQGLDFCSLVCFLCPYNWKGLKDSAQCSLPVQSNQVKRCLVLKMRLWDVFLFFLRDRGLYQRDFVP